MSQKAQFKAKLLDSDITMLESMISEEILLETENLMDTEIDILPREIKKNIYETIVEERSIRFNTLIKLRGHRLSSHHCNCIKWGAEGFCHHIASTLIVIRKNFLDKKDASLKKKAKRTSGRKGSVDMLINQISPDEMLLFVKSFAKKDKLFKLLLQGTFVELLSQDELVLFIESSFPILTKPNEKISPARINLFLQVVEVLDVQFKDYISQKDYIQGYRLNFLQLRKSFYIKSKVKTERPKFESYHRQLINNYLETLNLVEAPEYRAYIFGELVELLSTSYISANTLEERHLWLSLYKDKEQHASLRDLTKIYQSHQHADISSAYFILMLELLLTKTQTELINKADLQTAFRVIQLLQRHKNLSGVTKLMKTYFINKPLSNSLASLILSYLEDANKPNLISACINYYLKYKQDVYLTWLKKNGAQWDQIALEITSKLKKSKDHFLEVQFHLANDQVPEALEVIRTQQSWKLLTQFDEHLYHLDKKIMIDLYKDHIRKYLLDHFGTQAKDYSITMIQRIFKIGGDKAKSSILSYIKKEFKDRVIF